MTSLDLSTILPEAALSIFALAALMLGAFFGKDRLAGTVLTVEASEQRSQARNRATARRRMAALLRRRCFLKG